jgi:hypothetical protein
VRENAFFLLQGTVAKLRYKYDLNVILQFGIVKNAKDDPMWSAQYESLNAEVVQCEGAMLNCEIGIRSCNIQIAAWLNCYGYDETGPLELTGSLCSSLSSNRVEKRIR